MPLVTRHGTIELIAGVMFSGKSEELIRRVRRAIIARRAVQVFKSHLDARYAGLFHVSSHDGREVEAIPINTAAEIFRQVRPDTEIVAIDEAQFLDGEIVTVATALAERGARVILAGTDTDFRGGAVRRDGRPDGGGRGGHQAPGHLRRVRRAGLPQPAPGGREAGAVGLPHDHGRRARELRGALSALSSGAAEGRGSDADAVIGER